MVTPAVHAKRLMVFSRLCALLMLANVSHAQTAGDIKALVARVENNIIPISSAGTDTGAPQSLLARMQALQVPGVSIAVFDSGKIVWAKGYGLRDVKFALPVDTNTIFQAASISKPVTTAAMFILAEKGLINIDEDINHQLHGWQVPENDYTTSEKVTPKRIVAHMAGLSVHGFRGYSHRAKIPSLLQVLNGARPANSKPVQVIYTPGTRQEYSGGGFEVLQLLLMEKTGQSFPALMHNLVLAPASMNHSRFGEVLPDNLTAPIAKAYLQGGKPVQGGYNIYPEQAAAGLWTTPTDLARFMINIGNSYKSDSGLLRQATVQMMFTRQPNGNGLGFGIAGADNSLSFEHSGSNVGYRCYAIAFANTISGMVIMTNSDNGNTLIRELSKAVYREYGWGRR